MGHIVAFVVLHSECGRQRQRHPPRTNRVLQCGCTPRCGQEAGDGVYHCGCTLLLLLLLLQCVVAHSDFVVFFVMCIALACMVWFAV